MKDLNEMLSKGESLENIMREVEKQITARDEAKAREQKKIELRRKEAAAALYNYFAAIGAKVNPGDVDFIELSLETIANELSSLLKYAESAQDDTEAALAVLRNFADSL